MKAVLVRGGYVATMDPAVGDLADADVLIQGDRIVDIGAGLPAGGADIVEAAGRIVVPGLIDAHRHVWQSLLHGFATDLGLPTYLRRVRGGYGGCFDPDAAYLANLLGGLESLSAGVTTVVDHSHLQTSADISVALLRGLWDSGIGGYFAYGLQNAPDWLSAPLSDAGALTELLLRSPDAAHEARYEQVRTTLAELDEAGAHRIRLGVALPETGPYLPLDGIRALLERVRALDPSCITAHWDTGVAGMHESSTLEQVAAEGLLDRPILLTHGNDLPDADLDILCGAGIGLVTTPSTEAGMAMGPFAVGRLLDRGGAGALGTDTSCYAQANLLGEARAWLDAERRDARTVEGRMPEELRPARHALELATVLAARTLGLGDEIGTLAVGKRANVTVVAPDPVRARPAVDPIGALVYYTDPGDVEAVFVDGEFRKRGGTLTGIDTTRLAQQCAESLARLSTRFAALPHDVIDGALRGII
jgi:cytosine/adenosine deaminase-related metal-dependent hydrolase